MTMEPTSDPEVDEIWRSFLATGDITRELRMRKLFKLLPHDPRCKNCYAPFEGMGSYIVRGIYGKRPSKLNPRICNVCEDFATKYQGGVEVELTMLFADVRGSTTLAERVTPSEFSRLINRFYRTATDVLIHSDALIDKLIGDEVVGIYVPGYAGLDHAHRAIQAAEEILLATGHADAHGPWIPVGAGVHTGVSYVGSVGSKDGVVDITALGDVPNVAARLASQAAPGELIFSADAAGAAKISTEGMETRRLSLKGRSGQVDVFVQKVGKT